MGPYNLAYEIREIEERRLGLDRRRFSYTCHIPERRCGQDRRCLQVKLSLPETRSARPLRVIQGPTRQPVEVSLCARGVDRRQADMGRKKFIR